MVRGVARRYDAEFFRYTLSLENHRPLRENELTALKVLIVEGLATNKQKALVTLDKQWKEIRALRRVCGLPVLQRKYS